MLIAVSNRIVCHMKLFNFEEALADCEMLLSKEGILRRGEAKQPLLCRDLSKDQGQKAMVLTWKGYIAQSIKQFEEILAEEGLAEEARTQLQSNLDRLRVRQDSLKLKRQGDAYFKLGNLEKAIGSYEKSLDLDSANELAIANKSLIELKQEKFTECIASCDSAIGVIDKFTHYTNSTLRRSSQATGFWASRESLS